MKEVMLSILKNHRVRLFKIVPPLVVTVVIAFAYSLYSAPEQPADQHWGNISLQMVVDTIHDNYAIRTGDFFLTRNKATALEIKKTPAALHLYDDLAVGYARLKDYRQALDQIEKKKQHIPRQEELHWYKYFANRGSFLFNIGLDMVFKEGNPGGKEYLLEALQDIRKALNIYPHDHFYREHLEVLTVQWFLRALDKPSVLNRENIFGLTALNEQFLTEIGSPEICGRNYARFLPEVIKGEIEGAGLYSRACPILLKSIIAEIRLGRGGDSFMFLTIGNLLLEMGEPYYAWHAYARAVLMKHPAEGQIKAFMKKLSYLLAGPEDPLEAIYPALWDEYHSATREAGFFSDSFRIHERTILKEGGEPTTENILGSF